MILVFVLVSSVLGNCEPGGGSGSSANTDFPRRFTSCQEHSYPSSICDHTSGTDQCDPGFEMSYFFSDKVDNKFCRENNSMLIVSEVIPPAVLENYIDSLSFSISCSTSESEIIDAEWITPNGAAMEDDSLICTDTSVIAVIPYQTLDTNFAEGVHTCRLTAKQGVQVVQHIGVYVKHPGKHEQ